MRISKAIKKVGDLNITQLNHFIQLCDTAIFNYRLCIENYSPRLMERCGLPFLNRLELQRAVFINELRQRNER